MHRRVRHELLLYIYINHRFRRRALLLLKLQSCTSHTHKAQQSHSLLRGQVCSTCVWQEGGETFQSNEKNSSSNNTALQTTQAVYYLISPIRFIISSHFSSLTHRGIIKGVNTLKNILNEKSIIQIYSPEDFRSSAVARREKTSQTMLFH